MIELETGVTVGGAAILAGVAVEAFRFLTQYVKSKTNGGVKKINGVCAQHGELSKSLLDINATVTRIDMGMAEQKGAMSELKDDFKGVKTELFSRMGSAEGRISVVEDRTNRRQ